MGRDGQLPSSCKLCASLQRVRSHQTLPLRDLIAGRRPEVIGKENMAVVSQHPAAALQGETGLDIERDAKVKP